MTPSEAHLQEGIIQMAWKQYRKKPKEKEVVMDIRD